ARVLVRRAEKCFGMCRATEPQRAAEFRIFPEYRLMKLAGKLSARSRHLCEDWRRLISLPRGNAISRVRLLPGEFKFTLSAAFQRGDSKQVHPERRRRDWFRIACTDGLQGIGSRGSDCHQLRCIAGMTQRAIAFHPASDLANHSRIPTRE